MSQLLSRPFPRIGPHGYALIALRFHTSNDVLWMITSLAAAIANQSCEHYREHVPDLKAWLQALQAS